MRNQIVLPGKIIETLAHKAAVGLEIVFGVFVFLAGADDKHPSLVRFEIRLKDHDVGLVQFVIVRIHRLRKQFFAGRIAHVNFVQIFFAKRREIFRRELDSLARPGDRQGVDGFDGKLGLRGTPRCQRGQCE